MIKAILFDLDNTLYSETNGLEARVLERMNRFVADFLMMPLDETAVVRREGSRRYGTTLEWLMEEKGFRDPEAYFRAVHPEDEIEGLAPDPQLKWLLEFALLRKSNPDEFSKGACRASAKGARCGAVFLNITDIRSKRTKRQNLMLELISRHLQKTISILIPRLRGRLTQVCQRLYGPGRQGNSERRSQ